MSCRGVGARILRPGSRETRIRLIRLAAWRRADYGDEVTNPFHVQDEIRRRQLASYDRALVHRGDVTVWLSPEAIATWESARIGTRGGPPKYSNLAIETSLTLRLLFHLPTPANRRVSHVNLRDHGPGLVRTGSHTLSRRSQSLDLALRRVRTRNRLHLVVDSTGLSIVGEGEWAAAKHGGRGKRGGRSSISASIGQATSLPMP
jgi:hypothetical protein